MRLRKTTGVPGAAPGGYTWDTDTDEVEVPDDLAAELLGIPGAGFAEVATDDEADSDTPVRDDSPADGPGDTKPPAKTRTSRGPRKTTVAE